MRKGKRHYVCDSRLKIYETSIKNLQREVDANLILNLMDIRPDYANIEDEDGKLEQVDPDEVEVGTVIVVQPGERVPIDGVIVEGASAL